MKYKPFFLFLIAIAILVPVLQASTDDSGIDLPLSALCSPPSHHKPLSHQFTPSSSAHYELLLTAARDELIRRKPLRPRRSFSLSDYGNFSEESSLVSTPGHTSPVPQEEPNIPLVPFPPQDEDTPLSPSRALLSPLKKLNFNFQDSLLDPEVVPENQSPVSVPPGQLQRDQGDATPPPSKKHAADYQAQLDFQRAYYNTPQEFSWYPRDGHMMF